MRSWPIVLVALVAGCGGDGGPARPCPDVVQVFDEPRYGSDVRGPLPPPVGDEIKARTAICWDEFGPDGAHPVRLRRLRGIPPEIALGKVEDGRVVTIYRGER